jgi:hypothetical protein
VAPSPVVLSTVPSTLPSPPTPTVIANFPSSDVHEVVHESSSTVIRQSNYITPPNSVSAPPASWFSIAPSSVSSPVVISATQIPNVPSTDVIVISTDTTKVVIAWSKLPSSVPTSTVVAVSPVPSSIPIAHVSTIVIHTHTTYFVAAPVSPGAPPIFVYTL